MSLRSVVAWTTAFVFVPIFGEFSVELARQFGLYNEPVQVTTRVIEWITSEPSYPYVAVFMAGLTLGIYADAIVRRVTKGKETKKKLTEAQLLGGRCKYMAERIRKEVPGAAHHELSGLVSEYKMLATDLEDIGLDNSFKLNGRTPPRNELLPKVLLLERVAPYLQANRVSEARQLFKARSFQ